MFCLSSEISESLLTLYPNRNVGFMLLYFLFPLIAALFSRFCMPLRIFCGIVLFLKTLILVFSFCCFYLAEGAFFSLSCVFFDVFDTFSFLAVLRHSCIHPQIGKDRMYLKRNIFNLAFDVILILFMIILCFLNLK